MIDIIAGNADKLNPALNKITSKISLSEFYWFRIIYIKN
jgi:hypothetical protein